MIYLVDLKELEEAAKPLIDILYKHFNPHSAVIVTQTSVEVMVGTASVSITPRD